MCPEAQLILNCTRVQLDPGSIGRVTACCNTTWIGPKWCDLPCGTASRRYCTTVFMRFKRTALLLTRCRQKFGPASTILSRELSKGAAPELATDQSDQLCKSTAWMYFLTKAQLRQSLSTNTWPAAIQRPRHSGSKTTHHQSRYYLAAPRYVGDKEASDALTDVRGNRSSTIIDVLASTT
jgi:hypothetical protein